MCVLCVNLPFVGKDLYCLACIPKLTLIVQAGGYMYEIINELREKLKEVDKEFENIPSEMAKNQELINNLYHITGVK